MRHEGGLNLYVYAENSPQSYVDPFGECPNCWVTVRCRGVGHWAAKLGRAKHCYIIVNGPSGPTTFSGGPSQAKKPHFLKGWPDPRDPAPGNNVTNDKATWFSDPVDCSITECFQKATDTLNAQNFDYRAIKGPNSNFYVRELLLVCGFPGVPMPRTAYGRNYFK